MTAKELKEVLKSIDDNALITIPNDEACVGEPDYLEVHSVMYISEENRLLVGNTSVFPWLKKI